MMGMTSSYGYGGMNIAFGWHIHMLFGVALVVGLVLLVVWAIKALGKEQLRNFALWITIISIVGVLLTSYWGMIGMQSMLGGGHMENIDWEEMGEHMSDQNHDNLKSGEDWTNHMQEEMKEHMGW